MGRASRPPLQTAQGGRLHHPPLAQGTACAPSWVGHEARLGSTRRLSRGGRAAIDKVMNQQPAVVLLVPREMRVEHSGGVKSLSDEELERGIEMITAMLAARDAGASARVIEAEPTRGSSASFPKPTLPRWGARRQRYRRYSICPGGSGASCPSWGPQCLCFLSPLHRELDQHLRALGLSVCSAAQAQLLRVEVIQLCQVGTARSTARMKPDSLHRSLTPFVCRGRRATGSQGWRLSPEGS